MSNKTALICGVSGQDGSLLAKALLNKGYNVHGASRDAELASFQNLETLGILEHVTTHSMSLKDFRSVQTVLEDTEPDEVYNLSGQSSVGLSFDQPLETIESIVIGSLNLLEACRGLDSAPRLYFAGSGECYGNVKPESPANEETAFRPVSPYGVAKAAAHWQVASHRSAFGLFACSGILFNHESELRPRRFVTKKIVQAACDIARGSSEKLILGDVSIKRDWGWAPEYVEAMWLMLQQDTPDDYVISTGESHSLGEFVERVFAYLNLDWQEYTEFDKALLRASEISENYSDPWKAKNQLGWAATVRFDELIGKLVRAELAKKV